MLHLAELFAILGIGAMVMARAAKRLPLLPFTPEIAGLAAFGGAMLVGIPFSFWPGGSVKDFTEIYLKLFVIVVLMVHSLDRVDRLDRFVWLIVLCSGYVAAHSLFNYLAGGANLDESGRMNSAVGGIFGNPNDLALNMVVFMPFALATAFEPGPAPKRLLAVGCALLMVVTVFFTKSRGGFLGLGAMLAALVVGSVRVRPAIGVAAVLAVLAAMPLAPATFWSRMVSIVDADKDPNGSRQARIELMKEATHVFVANPIIGIGLGQFVNYAPDQRQQKWHVAHNATLQVAAELGIVGLVPFFYLIARAALAVRATRRALVPPTRGSTPRRSLMPAQTPARAKLVTIMTALGPGLLGWFVCAQFASVALNWTFYFVLGIIVATRDIVLRLGPTAAASPARVS